MPRRYKSPLKPYGKRNIRLRKAGLADNYREYLASELWASIRQRVLERDGNTCRICGWPANSVHHSNYSSAVMEGRSLIALFAICSSCHKFIEFDKEGNKCHPNEVRKRVRMLSYMKGRQLGYDTVSENQANDISAKRAAKRAAKLQRQRENRGHY